MRIGTRAPPSKTSGVKDRARERSVSPQSCGESRRQLGMRHGLAGCLITAYEAPVNVISWKPRLVRGTRAGFPTGGDMWDG